MLRRTSFLGSLSALAVAGIVPVVVACNGHVSLGNNTGDTLQAVSTTSAVAEINGTGGKSGAITCAAGWAHPNVCCSAGPNVASACGAWEENPFRACAAGDTTYPNLLSCCDLKDPSQCVDASPSSTDDAGIPLPPPAYGCGFACPVGWWASSGGAVPVASGPSGGSSGGSSSSSGGSGNIGGEEGPMCCTTVGTETECVSQGSSVEPVSDPVACGGSVGYGGSSSGSSSGGTTTVIDAGPVFPTDAASPPAIDAGTPYPITEDAGTLPGGWFDDGGCDTEDAGAYNPYPPGYDGGTASLCDPCPPGWSSSDPSQPELCCQTIPGNVTLCFSQAVGSATSVGESDDGGSSVAPTPVGVGTVGNPGSSGWGSGSASEPDGGVGGPNCSGSDSSCSCDETTNGHTYALDCYATSSGTISCSCTIDGVSTGATPTVDSCQDSAAVPSAFSASNGCNFPL